MFPGLFVWNAEKWLSKDICILILRTCDYVSYYDKRDFEDMIKLRILTWGENSGSFGWAQHSQKDPGGSELEKDWKMLHCFQVQMYLKVDNWAMNQGMQLAYRS